MPNIIGPAWSWRLVHDGAKVLAIFESSGYTESIHALFESPSKDACLAEADRLNLQPLPEPAPATGRMATPLEFMDRFSEQTQIAVVSAAQTSPAVKLWYDRLLASSEINLDSPRLRQGLRVLVAAGVISQLEADASTE